MRTLFATVVTGFVLAISGCGGASIDSSAGGSDAGDADSKPTVKIVSTGFGQSGEYVQGIAIVTTDDEAAVGEYATVSMNFLDADGEILGTEEQVETFAWSGQELVLPVFLDLSGNPKADVASVEASVSLSDYGSSQDPLPPLDTIESKSIGKGEYGDTTAVFEFTNTTREDLEDLRIGIVCRDQADKIIGGASEYPELVEAGKTIRLDVSVTTTGTPATCRAYPNYEVL
jgi:hypothetical protein